MGARDAAELVRDLIEAWNGRDLEGVTSLASPDIEYVNSPIAVEPGTRHGREQYASVLAAQWEIIGDAQLEMESLQTAGDEVFALLTVSRSLEGSDARLAQRIGMCATIRDGMIVRQAMLPPEDFQEALEAAGLGR